MTTPGRFPLAKTLAPYRTAVAVCCLLALGWFLRDAWDWANRVDIPAGGGLSYDRDTVLKLGPGGLNQRVNRMDTYSMIMARNLEDAALQSLIYERMGKSDVRRVLYYEMLHDAIRDAQRARISYKREFDQGGPIYSLLGQHPNAFLSGFVNRMQFPDPLGDQKDSNFPASFGERQRSALEKIGDAAAKHAETLSPTGRQNLLSALEELQTSFRHLLNTVNDLPLHQAQEVLDYAFPLDAKGQLKMPTFGE